MDQPVLLVSKDHHLAVLAFCRGLPRGGLGLGANHLGLPALLIVEGLQVHLVGTLDQLGVLQGLRRAARVRVVRALRVLTHVVQVD